MASALHIYPSPFTHESRILKETRSLVESGLFETIVIGAIWEKGLAEYEALDVHRQVWRVSLWARQFRGVAGKLIRFVEWYVRIFLRFRKSPPDFINCHSLSSLPLGALFGLFLGSRIIYDTHELETETQSSTGIRKWLSKLVERAIIRRAAAVVVVSESIGQWYRETYKLNEVIVVRNIPYTHCVEPNRSRQLRRMYALKQDEILFICQGVMDRGRGIEIILEAFSRLPANRHVLFLGYGPLVKKVQDWAARYDNIHYHAAVPPDMLLEYTAGADIGISLIERTSLSYYYSLPNKVFEYIHSGIPVIVSDFPEMAKLVDSLGCGWKSPPDVESLIDLVATLSTEEIIFRATMTGKNRYHVNWNIEEGVLIALYERLLGSKAIPHDIRQEMCFGKRSMPSL